MSLNYRQYRNTLFDSSSTFSFPFPKASSINNQITLAAYAGLQDLGSLTWRLTRSNYLRNSKPKQQ